MFGRVSEILFPVTTNKLWRGEAADSGTP